MESYLSVVHGQLYDTSIWMQQSVTQISDWIAVNCVWEYTAGKTTRRPGLLDMTAHRGHIWRKEWKFTPESHLFNSGHKLSEHTHANKNSNHEWMRIHYLQLKESRHKQINAKNLDLKHKSFGTLFRDQRPVIRNWLIRWGASDI